MIKFIKTQDVLPIRNIVLREGKLADEACFFLNDDAEDTFHLGFFVDEELVSVATFHRQTRPGFIGEAFQLRGMATLSNYQGKGFGNQLLNFAIVYLRGQKLNYIWCNAREKAFRFYQSLGFEFISEAFEIPGIGLHKAMYLKIQ